MYYVSVISGLEASFFARKQYVQTLETRVANLARNKWKRISLERTFCEKLCIYLNAGINNIFHTLFDADIYIFTFWLFIWSADFIYLFIYL